MYLTQQYVNQMYEERVNELRQQYGKNKPAKSVQRNNILAIIDSLKAQRLTLNRASA